MRGITKSFSDRRRLHRVALRALRRLVGKPTTKGVYIVNGKKVVISSEKKLKCRFVVANHVTR